MVPSLSETCKHHHAHADVAYSTTRGTPFLARTVVANHPQTFLNQTEVRVQMTRNHSQFVSELLPARRLHTGHLTAMNRSPQRPDELIRKIINKIRIVFATILGFVGLMAVFLRASAQMIVPVDRTLHPPEGFDFGGQWKCGDGVSIAQFQPSVK